MAIRIRSRFHTEGQRSMATLASVVAMLAWKLAVDSIKRLREAKYDIDIGRPYFDYVCEFMAFLAHGADRIAFMRLTAEERVEFTTALAKRLSEVVEENRDMLLAEPEPDACRRHFLRLFNERGAGYGEFGWDEDGPDFGFRRYFAAGLREVLPEKDRLWVIDQAMDIEAPEAVGALKKTLAGLFAAPGEDKPRRGREGVSGD
ncbi:MAG: hypothetical protein JNK22_14115 [Rhodocyclaceae bacterium]|nr:hypothetical protein [Rhodocyclaceae bacterium]